MFKTSQKQKHEHIIKHIQTNNNKQQPNTTNDVFYDSKATKTITKQTHQNHATNTTKINNNK